MIRIVIAGTLLIAFTDVESYSQQLSHQVLVPVAGIACNKNINYSQTIGETVVEIVGCYDYVFTQGFQQPGIKPSVEDAPPGTGVKVYPNPATDHITVELFGEAPKSYKIELLDITGTVVTNARKAYSTKYWEKEQIDITNLIRGFYMVRITSDDKLVNRTFKIEKI